MPRFPIDINSAEGQAAVQGPVAVRRGIHTGR